MKDGSAAVTSEKVLKAIRQLEALYKQEVLSTQELDSKKIQLLAQLDDGQQSEVKGILDREDLSTRAGRKANAHREATTIQELVPVDYHTPNSTSVESSTRVLDTRESTALTQPAGEEDKVGSGQLLCERYLLKAQLGSGGMGQVFLAEDIRFQGEYAIKVFHPWMMNNERSLQGFQQEFKFLEDLTHPGVVRVFSMNEDPTTGFLFYTMEYVKGRDLQSLVDEAQSRGEVGDLLFPLDETIRLLERLAGVLEYIHEQRIIHRDLKPGNIMLLEGGRIKLLDFGIAKSLKNESTFHTGYKGTFFYIAPEQLVGGEEVLPAADLFSLGVLMYQLLTGEIPVGMAVLPSELNSQLTPQIDNVIRKAMHPRWNHRYQTVSELMEAFRAALPSLGSRSSSSDAPVSSVTPNASTFRSMPHRQPLPARNPAPSVPLTRSKGKRPVRRETGANTPLPSFSRAPVGKMVSSESSLLHGLQGHHAAVTSIVLDPREARLASASADQSIKIWEMGSWFLSLVLSGHRSGINTVRWNPGGDLLCSGSSDNTMRVWDMKTTRQIHMLKHPGSVNSVLWSDDGRMLISGCADHKVRIWEVETGRLLYTLDGHEGAVTSLDLNLQGQYLLSSSLDASVRLWEVGTGRQLFTFKKGIEGISCVKFCPGGPRLVAGSLGGNLMVWSLDSSQLLHSFAGHHGKVSQICVSPKDRWMVSAGYDKEIKVWHLLSGRHMCSYGPLASRVNTLAITKDERRIIVGCDDGSISMWDTAPFLKEILLMSS